MRLMRVALLMFVLLALGAVALYQYRTLPSVATVGGVGDELRLHHYGATVVSAQRLAGLGEGPSRIGAKGVFVMVRLRVANHAPRVNLQFEDRTIVLTDSRERSFGVSAEAQKYLRNSRANGCAAPLPPGGVCTTDLVFDVPLDADDLRLRMRFAGEFRDMLDTLLTGSHSIRLP